ncbi:serine hydrolase [Inquilinus sp. KBS0705]|nr:serine hydrolase [Inquilinus sp. KBS0705]
MKKFTLVIVVCIICNMASAQTTQQAIRDIINDNGVSGIQLVYTAKGKTLAINTGVAKEGTAKTISNSTIFRAGSLGKSVFEYAIMRLTDRGLINIDTPLLHYIGTYKRFDSKDPRFAKITARMVLSHTSGLEFYGDTTSKLVADPGKVFSYSSEGYHFLQVVEEKITNMPLEDMMQQEVFKPLGMRNSSYIKSSKTDPEVIGEDDLEPNAAFSLYTTAADYNAFLQALINHTGLELATAQQMFTKQSNAQWLGHDTTEADKYIDWGLGVGLQQNEQGKAIWHWGSVMVTFNSFYIAFPDKKESLVYFTNSITGLRAANEIVNLLLGKQTTWATKWLKLGYDEPETMLQLHKAIRKQGYANARLVFADLQKRGLKFTQRDIEYFGNTLLKQGKTAQSMVVFNQNAKLYPKDATVYNNLASVYLKLGNRPLALKNYRMSYALDTANTNVAYHIKALQSKVVISKSQLAAFAGKYKLNIMEGIFMDVKTKWPGLTIEVPGGVKDALFYPVSATEFLNDENGFTLKFNKDANGKVASILIHTKNTVDVWERVKE